MHGRTKYTLEYGTREGLWEHGEMEGGMRVSLG